MVVCNLDPYHVGQRTLAPDSKNSRHPMVASVRAAWMPAPQLHMVISVGKAIRPRVSRETPKNGRGSQLCALARNCEIMGLRFEPWLFRIEVDGSSARHAWNIAISPARSAWLRRRGMLQLGRYSSLIWSQAGEQTGSIMLIAQHDGARLRYQTKDRHGSPLDVNELVAMIGASLVIVHSALAAVAFVELQTWYPSGFPA